MNKPFEIRDPIHGFIGLNDWELEIVNHPVFQRLRRIRQLGLTDMVYPGATHTRFEHSLGVMHVAGRMFDEIVNRRRDFLENELRFNEAGLQRDRTFVRLAALLHDVGHAPFSHAAEGLMPLIPGTDKAFKHEAYSGAAIKYLMSEVIEDHALNDNYKFKASDIADFLEGRTSLGRTLLWRDLITGHLDADRADYLLRDSYHAGVEYGKYDLNRVLISMTVGIDQETNSPAIAIDEGGLHAAEGLILARYMMFTQVYFQHTRRAYDYHVNGFLKSLLVEETGDENATFPPPTSVENIQKYLEWTDWKALGLLANEQGGEDGRIIRERNHHRDVFETKEVPDQEDLDMLDRVVTELGDDVVFVDPPEKSWYNIEKTEIRILQRAGEIDETLQKLSQLSNVVGKIAGISQKRVYVAASNKEAATDKVAKLRVSRRDENDGS